MRLTLNILLLSSFAARLFAQSACVNFPSGLVPLSLVYYVTAANSSGDHLVVGALANGLSTLGSIPPSANNQLFCDSQVQLAPQQFFPNVYVPTTAERGGNFSAFTGLLVDPVNNQPFAGGIIPGNRLGAVYAFRIGATQPPQSGRLWSPTGSMSIPRTGQVMVTLPNGKVLVVSGANPGDVAEIYDPSTGTFSARQMLFAHNGATATGLNDGRVLIVGGNAAPNSAEVYDPVSEKFQVTGGPSVPRFSHTATLLKDGRVLIAAGVAGTTTLTGRAEAEIYDPGTGTFRPTGSLSVGRYVHAATLLADGRVLVSGGVPSSALGTLSLTSAEVFDPGTGKFSPTGAMRSGRAGFFSVRLPNGKVLVGGGSGDATAELFDPAAGSFSFTGVMRAARFQTQASILSSGQVLVTGGLSPDATPLNSTEIYTPVAGAFSETGNMTRPRFNHSGIALLDGRVLVAGGFSTFFSRAPGATAEIYTLVSQGLVTSQTGLTFRTAQGSGVAPSQMVAALSPTDTIPFNVSVTTFSGGNWLTATPAGGTGVPAGAPVNLTITADATGLSPTDYYGAVILTPTDGTHPPVSIAIVLTIVPAGAAASPSVSPSGVVFLAQTGISPKAQSFVIANVTSKALTFTGTATQTTSFFDFTPKAGTIAAGQMQSITVTPASAGLAAGVYRGSIKLTFSDNSTQTVDVLLVTSATAGTLAGLSTVPAATGCAPTKLAPVLTSIGTGFSAPVAWPTPIIAQVVDDCGVVVDSGSVTASFTNGDSALSLLNIGGGMWSATWVPLRNSAGAGVRADAQTLSPALAGTVQISGQVAANPKVPVVAAGGVLSAGDYVGSPAQGLLVAIFGSALADGALGNSILPLPQQLGSTSVFVSGVKLPLLYVSDGQVNVFIPYELAVNAPHQLVVQRANTISVPVPIAVFAAQPAILATAGNGAGQGHIYKIDASGAQTLADANSPAKAGDVLVIYTVGLGPVTPPLKSGDPAPFTQLEHINGTGAVTIGGVSAQVLFAGLTPGFSGLYQVNVLVPAGVAAGGQVPVTVSVDGRAGAGNIFMAIQ